MIRKLMIINNQFVDSVNGEYLEVINPATEEKMGEVPRATKEQVEEAVKSAHKAFQAWSKLTPFDRARYMHKAADIIEQKAEEIGRVLTAEEGKPLKEGVSEVKGSAEVIRYFAEGAKRVFGEIIPLNKSNIESLVI